MPRNGGIAARARGFVLGSMFLFIATAASLVAPTITYAATREAPVVRGDDATQLGNALLDWTNTIRRRHGLRALRGKTCVARYATRHSARMAERRRLFHSTSADLVGSLDGANWSTLGENVGMGTTLRKVERAFLRSSEHRANLLNGRFDHVGLGVVVSRGRVWVTSVFYG